MSTLLMWFMKAEIYLVRQASLLCGRALTAPLIRGELGGLSISTRPFLGKREPPSLMERGTVLPCTCPCHPHTLGAIDRHITCPCPTGALLSLGEGAGSSWLFSPLSFQKSLLVIREQ
ncbi:unnamed protein product [Pleuronectes platessa]|uniref:Uncharacterized protein n=1 Tax=Pleuronectes platessa TaxID=8262 RepID=A0A9N7YCP1_PLEPL|nr:unnamed protein product [Pleuronectes platessa]